MPITHPLFLPVNFPPDCPLCEGKPNSLFNCLVPMIHDNKLEGTTHRDRVRRWEREKKGATVAAGATESPGKLRESGNTDLSLAWGCMISTCYLCLAYTHHEASGKLRPRFGVQAIWLLLGMLGPRPPKSVGLEHMVSPKAAAIAKVHNCGILTQLSSRPPPLQDSYNYVSSWSIIYLPGLYSNTSTMRCRNCTWVSRERLGPG
jgi:hypothetical protein